MGSPRNLIQNPELIRRLQDAFGLRQAHVTPSLGDTVSPVAVVADLSSPTQLARRFGWTSLVQNVTVANNRVLIGIHNRTDEQELVTQHIRIDTVFTTAAGRRVSMGIFSESDASTFGLLNTSTLQTFLDMRSSRGGGPLSSNMRLISGAEFANDKIEYAAAPKLPIQWITDAQPINVNGAYREHITFPIYVPPRCWLLFETQDVLVAINDGVRVSVAATFQPVPAQV